MLLKKDFEAIKYSDKGDDSPHSNVSKRKYEHQFAT